jgi:hypothetical protein
VSFVEARELARILETNLAGLELAVEALERANDQATGGQVAKALIRARWGLVRSAMMATGVIQGVHG